MKLRWPLPVIVPKKISLSACAIGAGLLHVAIVAALLPLAITLPAPGADTGPRSVAIGVQILSEPSVRPIGEGDADQAPVASITAREAVPESVAALAEREPVVTIAEQQPVLPLAEEEPLTPSAGSKRVASVAAPMPSTPLAEREVEQELFAEEPVIRTAHAGGEPLLPTTSEDVTSPLPPAPLRGEPAIPEVEVKEAPADDVQSATQGDPGGAATATRAGASGVGSSIASVDAETPPPLPERVDREAWLTDKEEPKAQAAPKPAKPKTVRVSPKPAKSAPPKKSFLGLTSKAPSRRPAAKAEDHPSYKGSWGALFGAPAAKRVDKK